jgi:hypothetical protein
MVVQKGLSSSAAFDLALEVPLLLDHSPPNKYLGTPYYSNSKLAQLSSFFPSD